MTEWGGGGMRRRSNVPWTGLMVGGGLLIGIGVWFALSRDEPTANDHPRAAKSVEVKSAATSGVRRRGELDLRRSAESIRRYLTERVRDYRKTVNRGPGEADAPIGQITAGFQFEQDGFLALVFDTRANAAIDGEWNSFIEPNMIELEDWFQAFDELAEGRNVTVTLIDGTTKTLLPATTEKEFAALVGDVVRDALLEARRAGEFAALPLAKSWFLCVEHQTGFYGWSDRM